LQTRLYKLIFQSINEQQANDIVVQLSWELLNSHLGEYWDIDLYTALIYQRLCFENRAIYDTQLNYFSIYVSVTIIYR